MKIILYYQTFTDISPIVAKDSPVTHIHVAALHFGENDNGDPYIHLNDLSPYNDKYDDLWKDMDMASNLGIQVKLMIGGAGGAFTKLFSNYSVYYSFIKALLKNKPFITGIDLDIEETTALKDVEKLIIDLKTDFNENFTISMAPVQYSLQTDIPGIGGFSYKDLLYSRAGQYIDYLNGQFYDEYTEQAYLDVVNNKYNSNCVVMGMLGTDNLKDRLDVIHTLYLRFGENFGGVYLWEYNLGEPNWATQVKKCCSKTFLERLCTIL